MIKADGHILSTSALVPSLLTVSSSVSTLLSSTSTKFSTFYSVLASFLGALRSSVLIAFGILTDNFS
jgi:hypothetical protein